MRLLLVEDYEEDQELCKSALDDFNEDKGSNIEMDISTNVKEVEEKIRENNYDGIILDMKLANEGNEGNQVIHSLITELHRVPIIIMTGTPDVVDINSPALLRTYTKGDSNFGYYHVIEYFWKIYNTGLMNIIGGKGEIEKQLSNIFLNHLIPQIKNENSPWIAYGEDSPEKTEKAFLRHTLNHLIYHLDNDLSNCYPEEMYIYLPEHTQKINTGCILKNKENNFIYIVMNPACDLVVRKDGNFKTDKILLVQLQLLQDIIPEYQSKGISKEKKKQLERIRKNKENGYYHWLHSSSLYNAGAVINFRWISTYNKDEIDNNFEFSGIQVSSSFIKDITSRFSSYYARQGQPDLSYSD